MDAKDYTGQYGDSLTGLDYYHARYYDPAVGVFLSADSTQGNAQGMNPYAYVGGNPETENDPTGQYFAPPGGNPGNPNPPPCNPSIEQCGTQGSGYGDGGSNTPTNAGSHGPPTVRLKKVCAFICGGIKNGWLFAQGVGEVTTALAIFAGSIASLFYTGGGVWLKFILALAKTAVQKFAYAVIDLLRMGIQNILDSLQSYSPWLRVGLDVLQIVADVTALLLTAADIASLIENRQGSTIIQQMTSIAKGVTKAIAQNKLSTSIFGGVLVSLAGDVTNVFGTGFGLMNDVETLFGDIHTAQNG